MSANHFDQAARHLIRTDPAGLLSWMLRTAVEFRGWLDTRAVVWPGASDRTGDMVAWVREAGAAEPEYAVAAEVQTEPDFDMTPG